MRPRGPFIRRTYRLEKRIDDRLGEIAAELCVTRNAALSIVIQYAKIPGVYVAPEGRPRVRLTIEGVTKTLLEWAEQAGLDYNTLYRRYRDGWQTERLLEPPRPKENGK